MKCKVKVGDTIDFLFLVHPYRHRLLPLTHDKVFRRLKEGKLK